MVEIDSSSWLVVSLSADGSARDGSEFSPGIGSGGPLRSGRSSVVGRRTGRPTGGVAPSIVGRIWDSWGTPLCKVFPAGEDTVDEERLHGHQENILASHRFMLCGIMVFLALIL